MDPMLMNLQKVKTNDLKKKNNKQTNKQTKKKIIIKIKIFLQTHKHVSIKTNDTCKLDTYSDFFALDIQKKS
jgi:hypothetical protein